MKLKKTENYYAFFQLWSMFSGIIFETMKISPSIRYSLGPGLIMASAAIGVSHLVQSTRAGAEFGFTLIWAVLLANIFKYPFLEFGPRYAVATGESMIEGFRKMGPYPFWIFVIFTISTMFTVQAAVTLVTASLAAKLFGFALSPFIWSLIILLICSALLILGQYSALDISIKLILVVLAFSTVAAFVLAAPGARFEALVAAPSVWNLPGITFLIALMGWMPIPIDASAWHSLWTHERRKQTGHYPSMRDSLLDFNIGYISAGVLALIFLALGAFVLFGKPLDFAASGAVFANDLVSIYTETRGNWSYWIIIIAAFTTMFSTTITVSDAYPRVCSRILKSVYPKIPESRTLYSWLLIGISATSLGLLSIWADQFSFLVTLATSLSFLTAPILAFINYRLVTSSAVKQEYQPGWLLRILSNLGLVFLTAFAILFLYWQLFVAQ